MHTCPTDEHCNERQAAPGHPQHQEPDCTGQGGCQLQACPQSSAHATLPLPLIRHHSAQPVIRHHSAVSLCIKSTTLTLKNRRTSCASLDPANPGAQHHAARCSHTQSPGRPPFKLPQAWHACTVLRPRKGAASHSRPLPHLTNTVPACRRMSLPPLVSHALVQRRPLNQTSSGWRPHQRSFHLTPGALFITQPRMDDDVLMCPLVM